MCIYVLVCVCVHVLMCHKEACFLEIRLQPSLQATSDQRNLLFSAGHPSAVAANSKTPLMFPPRYRGPAVGDFILLQNIISAVRQPPESIMNIILPFIRRVPRELAMQMEFKGSFHKYTQSKLSFASFKSGSALTLLIEGKTWDGQAVFYSILQCVFDLK